MERDVNRKEPARKLCVTGTEVQTHSGSLTCSEPSWGCHRWLGSALMSWTGGFQSPFSPFPPGSGTLYQNKNVI